MKTEMRHIVMTAVLFLATVMGAWGGNITFKAKLDSATLLMARPRPCIWRLPRTRTCADSSQESKLTR